MMIAILIAAIVAALVVFSFLCYKKAPPTQAIVVTGFGLSRPKVVCGRGVFVLPVVQRADRLNMRLLKIDVKTPETGVKTKEGVSLWLDSVVTVQVYSENSTVSDEEVRNAGYDDIKKYINSRQQAAISNFLGMDEAHINEKINDVLQGNLRAKEVKESEADAEIARQKKMVDLAAQEAEVQQRKLDAEVRKQADAELYRRQKEAEAQKYEAERAAEAAKFAKQQEAEGIELVGKAEAEAIRRKGLAEAEAMKQKAEAYKQYNDAAVAEMMIKVLPEIAKSVAQPLSSIDKVSIIGGDASGVSGVSGNVPVLMAQTMEAMKEATGIDMKEIVRANSIQAKTDRNINVTGLENLQTPQASAPTAETTADHATVTE